MPSAAARDAGPDRSLTPRYGLTHADLTYVHLITFGECTRSEAFQQAFPEDCTDKEGHPLSAAVLKRKAETKWKLQRVQRYIDYLETDTLQLAYDTEKETLVLGTRTERAKIAERMIQRDEAKRDMSAADRYLELMSDCEAEVYQPVKHGQREACVSLSSLLDGGARMRVPLAGKLRLLKRAGAPWSDKDPTAEISPLQKETIERNEKVTVLHGGSGVGKSAVGGMVALCALALPRMRIGILGATYDHASSEFQYVYEGFLKAFGRNAAKTCKFKFSRTHIDMEIETIWGAHIKAYSLEQDGCRQMYGKEFDLVILAEGSRITADVFWRAVFRGLQRRAMQVPLREDPDPDDPRDWYTWETGRAMIATTPDGYEGAGSAVWDNALKRSKKNPSTLHYGKVPFQDSVYLREADCLENPGYSRDAYYAAKRVLPSDVFQEQYEGKRVRRAGLVINEFDIRRHQKPMPPVERLQRMKFGVGFDTGKIYAAELVGLEPSEQKLNKWFLGEHTAEAQTIQQDVEDTKRMVVHTLRMVLGLGEDFDGYTCTDVQLGAAWELALNRVEIWNCDDACQSKEDLLEALGAPLTFDKPEFKGSIDLMNEFFKNDELFIAMLDEGEPACPQLVEDLGLWKWRLVKPTAASQKAQLKPEDRNDHTIDGGRYVLYPIHRSGPLEISDIPAVSMEEAYQKTIEGVLLNPMGGLKPAESLGEHYRRWYH